MKLILYAFITSVSVFLSQSEEPAATSSPPSAAPATSYEVWKLRQEIREHPYSFSRLVARVGQGTALEVLERREPSPGGKTWGRVRASEAEGWTILDEPPSRAGSRIAALEGTASPASLSIAAKAFDKLSGQIAEAFPDAESRFEEILGSSLEPEEVEGFARAEGLRVPGVGRSR